MPDAERLQDRRRRIDDQHREDGPGHIDLILLCRPHDNSRDQHQTGCHRYDPLHADAKGERIRWVFIRLVEQSRHGKQPQKQADKREYE